MPGSILGYSVPSNHFKAWKWNQSASETVFLLILICQFRYLCEFSVGGLTLMVELMSEWHNPVKQRNWLIKHLSVAADHNWDGQLWRVSNAEWQNTPPAPSAWYASKTSLATTRIWQFGGGGGAWYQQTWIVHTLEMDFFSLMFMINLFLQEWKKTYVRVCKIGGCLFF